MKLELHTQILSGAKNYINSDFYRNFVSQNKAKNAGRSRKNAGMREIDRNAGFRARLRDG